MSAATQISVDDVVDAINAERGRQRISVTEIAQAMGRPYDSTRNYLAKDRPLPMDVFLSAAAALNVSPEDLLAEARRVLERS